MLKGAPREINPIPHSFSIFRGLPIGKAKQMTDQANLGLAANSTHKLRATTTHSPKLRMIGPDQVAEVHPGLLVLVTFEFYPYFDLSIALSALKNAVNKTEKTHIHCDEWIL